MSPVRPPKPSQVMPETQEGLEREIGLLRKRVTDLEAQVAREFALEGAPENRQILEAVPTGIVHVSAGGRILYANQEALRLLGLSYDARHERYMADTIIEAIFEDGSPCVGDQYPVNRCLSTGQAQPPTLIGLQNLETDDLRWALFRAIPTFPGQEGQHGAVVTLVDVTEQQEAREEQRRINAQMQLAQKLEALQNVVRGVGHDLGNVLTIIKVTCEVLLMEQHSAELTEDLEAIFKSSLHGAEILASLRTFAGRDKSDKDEISLNRLATDVHGLMGRSLVGRHLALELQEGVAQIEGNEVQLKRVLTNLCVNARDAVGEDGRIAIRTFNLLADPGLQAHQELNPGRPYVCLQVSDNGTGMSPEVLEQVFEPYFTTKDSGTGLGLSMAYGAMKEHNGSIHIDSALGEGTVISAFFPALLSSVPEEMMARSSKRVRKVVLVVCDEKTPARKTHWNMLHALGCESIFVDGERGAVEQLEVSDTVVDAIVLDVVVPTADVMPMLERLGAVAPEATLWVATSYGHHDGDGQEWLQTTRQIGVLHKPLSMTALRQALG